MSAKHVLTLREMISVRQKNNSFHLYYESPGKYSTIKERMKSRNVGILPENVVILPGKSTILPHFTE
jgi:hypothetical protein